MALLLSCVKLRKKYRGKQRCMSGWILLWHVSPPAAVCNQEENELLSTRLAFLPSFFELQGFGSWHNFLGLAPLVQITPGWHGNGCFADLSALFVSGCGFVIQLTLKLPPPKQLTPIRVFGFCLSACSGDLELCEHTHRLTLQPVLEPVQCNSIEITWSGMTADS